MQTTARPRSDRISRLPRVLILSALLAGCSAATDYQAPQMTLAERFSRPAPVATRAEVEWWRAFGDPALDGLMAQAMQGSPRLAELRARLTEAEARARGARNPWRGNGNLTAETTSGAPDQGEASLSAVLDPAAAARGRGAGARRAAAELDLAEARRRLREDLALAYVDLRYSQALLAEKEADLRSRRRTLADIETQLAAGEATQLDVVRARSLVAETEAELPGIAADVVQDRNRISTLVGVPAGASGALAGAGGQPRPKALSGFGVPADLLRQRPDVARAERLYAAAVAELDAARAARWPSLSLTGLIRAPFSGGTTTRGLEAGLILPVFNQPTLAAEADAAGARAEQAYAQWRQAVLTAVEEVESGLAGLDAALVAARAAERALALDLEALDLTRRLLESRGNITVLDLLDRERAIANARSVLAGNRREVAVEFIRLQTALGGGVVATVELHAPKGAGTP